MKKMLSLFVLLVAIVMGAQAAKILIAKVEISSGAISTTSGTLYKSSAISGISSANKISGETSYVAITLTDGNYFQEGDSIVVECTKVVQIFEGGSGSNNKANSALLTTGNLTSTTPKTSWGLIPNSITANTSTISVGRTSSTYNGNITSFAIYRENTATEAFTVTFDAGDDGTCATTSITEDNPGAGVTLPTVTDVTEGKVFTGWYTAGDELAGLAGETYFPTEAITLSAKYQTIAPYATPTITEKNGTVQITSTDDVEGMTFKYSLDGGTTYSNYTMPFNLSEATTVKAYVTGTSTAYTDSEVAEASCGAIPAATAGSRSITLSYNTSNFTLSASQSGSDTNDTMTGKEGTDYQGWIVALDNEGQTGSNIKKLDSGSAINSETTFKGSNGRKITFTLPEDVTANRITLYSYTNGSGSDESSWYINSTSKADAIALSQNGVCTASNPDVRVFSLDNLNTFYINNGGYQQCFYAVVDYVDNRTKYAVTYNPGANGTGTIEAGEKTAGLAYTLSSETFTRDNYLQTGWATTDGGELAYELGGTYSTDAAIELFPVWTAAYTYTAGFSDYTKGIPAGWTFNYDSTNKFATSNGNISTADFIGTMNANGQTTPHSQSGMSDNWVAFGKKAGDNSNYAYAIFDLGVTTKIFAMNVTLYGGSSSSFNEKIEYLGEDGTTVKKTYTNALKAGNWKANSISKTDEVEDVRYIKVYGADKWVLMSAFSVTTADETVLGAKVKTNGAGWASFTPSQNATVATGATAYIVTAIDGTKATTEEVAVMKAGEGYFIKGAASTEYAVTYVPANEADDVTGSLLEGCLNATTLAANTTPYNYVLGTQTVNAEKKAGLFYVGANAVTLPSGKCYLASAISENPQNLTLDFDEATAINNVNANDNANEAAPAKVIKNGKLYIGNYNVAGARIK